MVSNENSPIPDEVVDKALAAYHGELQLWQIVGPMVERRRKPLPDREFWNAVRTEPAPIIITSDAAPAEPRVIHLQDQQFAWACVQFHGIQAALEAVRDEISALGR
jgi:hypothetical protein